jgi:SAM-dependent methyltransferase
MLLKCFGKLDELKQKQNMPKVRLIQGDCADLHMFEDGEFDCVVDTLTLHSTYDRAQHGREIMRLCKKGGQILLLERGQSYISIYNSWLGFKAARDLFERGTVEHLDMDKVVSEMLPGLKVVHKERKNLGMTYVYIIENTAE